MLTSTELGDPSLGGVCRRPIGPADGAGLVATIGRGMLAGEVRPVDDDELDGRDLAAVADGDAAALERLYERHHRAVYAFVRRYVDDRQLAEEAMQDTMITVWQQAATFRAEARVRTWIFGIARYRALALARRRRPLPVDPMTRHPSQRPRVAGPVNEWADDAAGPARIAVARDEVGRVATALRQLPDDQRECFLLAVAGSLAYDEIADLLAISVGTVKSRVARARRRLDTLIGASSSRRLPPPRPPVDEVQAEIDVDAESEEERP